MSSRGNRTRWLGLAMALALAGLLAPKAADAQTNAYSGSAAGDLVHVNALNIPDAFNLADIGVAPARAEMASTGLDPSGNSHAFATNIEANLLSGALPLNLVVESEQTAPPNNAAAQVNQLLDLPLNPLVAATVARTTAQARWNTGGCVAPGVPISHARTELADAEVLTGLVGMAVVALDNAQGDTVYTDAITSLVNVAAQTNKGVRSTHHTQVTAIQLFKGTANALTINVAAPPVVTATATGQPGGASVTYSEPILQVVDAEGMVLGELNAATANLELDLSPLAILRLGTLDATVQANGTAASGRATLLEVEVLPIEGVLESALTIGIAAAEASAVAPAGGVSCPATSTDDDGDDGGDNGECGTGNPLRELQVGPSTLDTVAGGTFTYTISVSNRGNCTLDNVKVVSNMDGPPGSKVTGTDPEADSIDGLTVTWDDIGPLDPGEVKVLQVTVEVPGDAPVGSDYSNDVTATATHDDDEFSQDAHVDGPEVNDAGEGACNLSGSTVSPSHEEVEPGEQFNVYVNLLNSGGEPCPGVTIKLPIDDGLEFVSCNHNCTVEDGVIIWEIDDITGDSLTLVATLQVPDDAADGTVYHQEVTITDGQTITKEADGPTVTGTSVLADFLPASLDIAGAGLPNTGAYIGLMVAMGLGLVGGGEFLRRRGRRREQEEAA